MRSGLPLLAGIALGLIGATAWGATQPYPDVSGLFGRVDVLSATMPAPCAAAPASDTLTPSVGSGTPCSRRPDATRATAVQAAVVSTDATGAWSVTWARATSPAPYINVQPVNPAGVQPYICNVAASTTAGASGRCWQTSTMTLPSVVTSILGIVLNPTASAGVIQVRLAVREPTQ